VYLPTYILGFSDVSAWMQNTTISKTEHMCVIWYFYHKPTPAPWREKLVLRETEERETAHKKYFINEITEELPNPNNTFKFEFPLPAPPNCQKAVIIMDEDETGKFGLHVHGEMLVGEVIPNLDVPPLNPTSKRSDEELNEDQLVINDVINKISAGDYMQIPPPLPVVDEQPKKKRVMKSFEERLGELREYKLRYGHLNVSTYDAEYASLGKWCENMRTSYKRRQEGKSTKGCLKITEEQIRAVEELGFQFGGASGRVTKTFDERLEELIEYKRIHGNVDVPVEYKANPPLGKWCTNMRQAYKRRQDGTPSYKVMLVTDERIKKLLDVGFDFIGANRGKNGSNMSFDMRLAQLKQFKAKHGHTSVPQKYAEDPSLGKWVNHIRTQYKLWKENKACKGPQINDERVKKLEEIDFQFNYRVGYKSFECRLQELKDFKNAYGHLNVPTKYPENPGLGKFVNHMRTHYKLWEADKVNYKGGRINDERIKALEEIGFQFLPVKSEENVNEDISVSV